MDCSVLQFDAVKTSVAELTLPSLLLLEVMLMVVAAVGWVAKTTVKVSEPPASEVAMELFDTISPTVSSSLFITLTLAILSPLKLLSPLIDAILMV